MAEKGVSTSLLNYFKSKFNTVVSNDISGAVSTHNTSSAAHSDIRTLITNLTTRLNTLADSDDTTLDQMSEIVAYIKSNKSLIESITTNKVSVSDIIDNLTTASTSKVLSANQGVEIKKLIDALQASIDSISFPVDSALSSSSTNAVQNKVIYSALAEKASTSYVDSAIEAAIDAAIAASY